MRLAWHIFCKDVRHLWARIAIVLLIVSAFTVATIKARPPFSPPGIDELRGLLSVLMPAAYAWLIVTLAHQEALTGDRQFWLTRPYSRGALFAAKALFILLFVTLTTVIKDVVIVTSMGFPILPRLPGLLLRLMAWTAWLVLPAWAVGAVTRDLQAAAMTAAGAGLLYALTGMLVRERFAPGGEWVRQSLGILVLLGLMALVVLSQYRRRLTAQARVMVVICALIVLVGLPVFPPTAAFAIQMLIQTPPTALARVQVTPDVAALPSRNPPAGGSQASVWINLPVRVSGAPPGMILIVDGNRTVIQSERREIWDSGWQQSPYLRKTEDYRKQIVYVRGDIYRALRDQPITVTLSLAMTLLDSAAALRIPAHQQMFLLEGSQCGENSFRRLYPLSILCVSAVKALPRIVTNVEAADAETTPIEAGTLSYAPWPVLLGQSPVEATALSLVARDAAEADRACAILERPDAQIVIAPQRPVAHLRRDVVFRGVRLATYALAQGSAELRAYSATPCPQTQPQIQR